VKLKTDNASAAIIIDKKNNFLLQKRDQKKKIFFPGHLGLFGGAKNKNESYINALKRELIEEIGFTPSDIEYFMKISFDFNMKVIFRNIYICKVDLLSKKMIKLNEGAGYVILNLDKMKKSLKNKNIYVPYDQLALWFYINKKSIN
jgi:8-oxo-dGTP pyrophosphatase MutT (NUDIX family)